MNNRKIAFKPVNRFILFYHFLQIKAIGKVLLIAKKLFSHHKLSTMNNDLPQIS